jgi:release factor glutamine methyltransferase
MPKARDALRDAVRVLKASESIDHPNAGKERYEAEELLEFVLGHAVDGTETVNGRDLSRYHRLVNRRASGVPVAFITGRTDFGRLSLEVRPGVFIPRQSSEFMVEQALRRLRARPEPVHVDIATGIGPVALGVAHSLARARVFGVDLSRRPLALARRNATRLGIANATFLHGDLFDPLPRVLRKRVDVVTGHLPYVGEEELETLPEEILRFEPMESLTDFSPTGLGLLTRVATEAPSWLRPGGWLLLEVSPDRSRKVSALLRGAGYAAVRSTKGDLPVSRVVVGRYSGAA